MFWDEEEYVAWILDWYISIFFVFMMVLMWDVVTVLDFVLSFFIMELIEWFVARLIMDIIIQL